MATHFYYNGHTYEIETAPLTWDAAVANAGSLHWQEDFLGVSMTSYVAIVDSAAENAAILKNIKASVPQGASVAADGGGADYLWLGASDSATEGVWQWTNGTAVSAGFQNWGSGTRGSEPDNFNGNQDFLAMGVGKWPAPSGGIGVAGQWNDLSGSNTLWSVIEWDGLIGTAGNDKLTGTAGDDVIDGDAGNDNIKGGDGADIIYAGDGNDKVDAGNGNNWVIAETGDTDSDDGMDYFKAGTGDDFLAAGTGDDKIIAGDGNNTVIGGSGNDIITTGAGNDIIDVEGYYTEDGVASEGNDVIKTGAGNDFIVLGAGYDKVWGGTGNDVFVFSDIPSATSTTVQNRDGTTSTVVLAHRINDFDAGGNGVAVDHLAFDSTVFDAFENGISATNFIKGKGLTGASANETGVDDFLIFDTSSGRLYYDADGNGSEHQAVLIAIIKGNTADFDFGDITII
ncbi:MAG TPA: lectin-like protein [Aromatoleum sp.]|uniref:lectin-like protein n=1 Tax=Aromatoleum sp. TaxID=2307007 RepID=UPI002B490CF6|nr:lectin-like protein [Aromatoleum sp.]HJV27042.1 lectin-like protein [Aromatoleum sp.]